jgi:hypothetical protein
MACAFSLTGVERVQLLAIPVASDELIGHHTLTDEDLVLLKSRR